ncbi:alpha-L-glutamate ligase-like protein [Thiohalomonas denitrificans]|uniref:alpha-L-glutamate ligase-like protein n=1 Tax=Thiohalomonas denitrificans TaxID=415747 RepID=UPI0026F2F2D8|nr:alpha-L-glutamate ligase-like protein [Thiohalomonas denitrificans]
MAWHRLMRLLPFRRLSEQGVLGMNRRNISYISSYNPRELYPLVDDKLKTKRLALHHGVTTPELLGVIEYQHDVTRVGTLVEGLDNFCIKPAKGSGGKGILVVSRVEDGVFYRSNGQELSLRDLKRHVSNILAGLFSLSGSPDVAVFEALIEADDSLRDYSFEGVPDVRIIVFRGFPVMAMMRLSCAVSHGKANLHQGAVGVGIDIASGAAVRAVQRNKLVLSHPDTGKDLQSLRIPQWPTLLDLSCACADMTGLGYLGVDLVLDRRRGPMLLELNARPGLTIQLANGAGLLPRLRRIEAFTQVPQMTIAQRVAYVRKHFASVDAQRNSPPQFVPEKCSG